MARVHASTIWSTTTDLSTTGQNSSEPKITSSSDGTKLTAIWYRFDGHNIVQTRSSSDSGATWGATTDLSLAGQNAEAPQITSSNDGTKITAIWRRYNGSNLIFQTRSSADSGATWGATTDLSLAGQSAIEAGITSSSDGTKLTAIWHRFDGSKWRVQARSSSDSGATWGATTDLSLAGQNADEPQITSSSDGTKLTAIWRRYDGSKYVVQTRSSSDSGATWGATTDLSLAGQHAYQPRITSSNDGTKLAAIWRRSDGSNTIIQTRLSSDGGATWSASTDLSAAGGPAFHNQIVTSSDSTQVTVVWSRYNGSNDVVQTRSSSDSGATWGATTDLSPAGTTANFPQVTSSNDGTTLTTIWQGSNGVDNIVQARSSSDSGATWGATTDLSLAGQNADEPQITSSNDGTKLATIWRRSDGSNTIIQTRPKVPAPTPAPTPTPTPVWRATLDPNGGSCIDTTTPRTTPWTMVFIGYHYLPNATDCTRDGFTFTGWASTTNPTTVVSLPTLTDPSDRQRRMFLSANADLIAIWTQNIDPISDLTVFANFLCGPCTNAWLLFTMPPDVTDYEVTVNDTITSCTQEGTFFELSLCELTSLTPGSTTLSVTPLNETTRGTATTVTVTLLD